MIPALHLLYQDDTYLRKERFELLIEELLARYGTRLYSPLVNYLSRADEINPTASYPLKSRRALKLATSWPDNLLRPLCRSALASGWREVDHWCMQGKSWRESVLAEFADSPYHPL
jgi:hypothetical protein